MWSRVHRYSRPSLPHQNPQTDERGVSSVINKLTFALFLFSQEVGSIIGKVSESLCSCCPCCWLIKFGGCVLRFFVTIGFVFSSVLDCSCNLSHKPLGYSPKAQIRKHTESITTRCFRANGLLNAMSRASYVLMIWKYYIVKFYS